MLRYKKQQTRKVIALPEERLHNFLPYLKVSKLKCLHLSTKAT